MIIDQVHLCSFNRCPRKLALPPSARSTMLECWTHLNSSISYPFRAFLSSLFLRFYRTLKQQLFSSDISTLFVTSLWTHFHRTHLWTAVMLGLKWIAQMIVTNESETKPFHEWSLVIREFRHIIDFSLRSLWTLVLIMTYYAITWMQGNTAHINRTLFANEIFIWDKLAARTFNQQKKAFLFSIVQLFLVATQRFSAFWSDLMEIII